MKTKHKIIIVIAITIFVYVGLRLGLIHLCNIVSEDCDVLYDFFVFTSIHVPSSTVGGEIVEWSGTAQPEFEIDYGWYAIQNLNFVLFFVVIPSSIIAMMLYRDRQ